MFCLEDTVIRMLLVGLVEWVIFAGVVEGWVHILRVYNNFITLALYITILVFNKIGLLLTV